MKNFFLKKSDNRIKCYSLKNDYSEKKKLKRKKSFSKIFIRRLSKDINLLGGHEQTGRNSLTSLTVVN